MKRSKVIVRENLVVGYWDLIPMESIKTHDQKLSHNAKILIIVVIIFYPWTQKNKYIELSQSETEKHRANIRVVIFDQMKTHV